MSTYTVQSVEVIESDSLTLTEVISYTALSRSRVIEMINAGVVDAVGDENAIDQCRFSARELTKLRTAQRLIVELGVNIDGAALILELLEERDSLRSQVELLRKMVEEA
jgi:chaperone modulatory protein CbpM